MIQQNEIQRRLTRADHGSLDPLSDYEQACKNVQRAHQAFKSSRDKKGTPSTQASENYAHALSELDIATRVLDIHNVLPKAS